MDHVSPFSNEIYTEWERLVFHTEPFPTEDNPPRQEQVDGWKALYEKAAPNGNWTVSAPDAGLVASLGITIALREERYTDAVALAKHYLAHPQAADDEIRHEHFLLDLGLSQYLNGEREEGASVLAWLLKSRHPAGFLFRLEWLIEETSTDNARPDPLIADLAALYIRGSNCHRSKARLARSARSNRKLLSVFESTRDHHRTERWIARMRLKYAREDSP